MTLDKYRDLADRMLGPFVGGAKRLGISPDGVSVVAFVAAAAAAVVFYLAGSDPVLYLAGAVLVFVNGWLDLVDGALARELDVSSRAGDLLDHVLDRYADIVLLVGLAAGIGRYDIGLAAVTGVLMTSYLGTQAQAVGLDRVYGGLVGRADRLALIGITAGVAAFYTDAVAGLTIVGWLLVALALVGHLTALQRFYYSMRALS
ncbi:archaetidylinositol phosphate synthase [Halomicrobium zhouii]|uniref:Archaetidylinositol phosphate synthase n=1 Tax=Halomicrobium zhouii TaxID=767519 RepID=A0A1I6LUE9_9EURY|nr:CDP-alcohol phosphatidyltransferase family protein [Halomicrobium zhouii]SFS07097.1 archaetidylinositol phosphate synthase [Halomicrobium zhouii]